MTIDFSDNKVKEEFFNKMEEMASHYYFGMKRKYTGEPYAFHPMEVMKLVAEYGGTITQQVAALFHDVVEDTEVTFDDLEKDLREHMPPLMAFEVTDLVRELTNVYTKERFPDMNRDLRSLKEIGRITGISKEAQFIKIADICHNTSNIVEVDRKFARRYLDEKFMTLNVCLIDGFHQNGLKMKTYSQIYDGMKKIGTDNFAVGSVNPLMRYKKV